jgi:hypothetical protein
MAFARRKGRHFKRVGIYRSPFEAKLAESLEAAGMVFEYEQLKLNYTIPETRKTYHPDFVLANGIIIEAKGEWVAQDRKKIQSVLEQHPDIDLRMVFYNANAKIYPGSKTTYASWCDEHGIKWSHRTIPAEWLKANSKKNVEQIKASAIWPDEAIEWLKEKK